MSTLVQICKKIDFGRNLRKISIFVKIFKKSRICSKFAKNLDFGQNFCKSRILIEIFENLDFVRTFENLDVGRKFWKISILVEIWKKNHYFGWNLKKMSKCGRIFENLEYDWNFRKILILVEISEKSLFWSKLSKIAILLQILKHLYFGGYFFKSRFWFKFQKSRIWS